MKLLWCIRLKLIRWLAQGAVIVLNARFKHGVLTLDPCRHAVIRGCKFEDNADERTELRWSEIMESTRQEWSTKRCCSEGVM